MQQNMAAVPQPSEQVRELLQNLKVDSQVQSEDRTEIPPVQEGNPANNIGNASAATGRAPIPSSNSPLQGMPGSNMYYAANGYVVPHGIVYDYGHAGYETPVAGEWEENGRFIGVEGMELHSPGIYGENSSVVFHPSGLSYASQPPYGSFSPGPHMPTMGLDGQLYGPSAFQYHGHIYHQSVPPGTQFMPAGPSGAVTTELPVSGSREPGPPGVDLSSGVIAARNSLPLGPRPGVPLPAIPPHGPYPRGILPVALHNSVTQDMRAPYEGLRSGAPSWPDPAKNADRRKVPVASAAMQTTGSQTFSSASYSTQIRPAPPIQLRFPTRQSQKAAPTVASPNLGTGVRGRNYTPAARGITSPNGYGRAGRGVGLHAVDSRANGRTWIGVDKSTQQGRGILPLYTGNQNLDILNEQNRGPRTARIRTQRPMPGVSRYLREPGGSSVGTNDVFDLPGKDQHNQPDFRTDYDEARFFVIKSYSEDDVHKSIKYLVWASTPNGNKRLDAAYQDAQIRSATKTGSCPIFMFFSVNASGQFCGVAEMTGSVDFSKSMDFWQQDKWNGRFPVKWHIIKDVPNIHFRHIILENNDNKPVTNSRDTQEVKFDQGIEMLNIFKKFTARTSILDDFHFYEARERVLQEKRGRSQMQLQQHLRLVYQSSNELEQGQVNESSNQSRFEKSNDGTIGSESSAIGALAEPGVKGSTTAHTGIHPAPLVSIPSKTSGESTMNNDGELEADLLVSAVANMKIQEKDGVADGAESDQHV
ncbi:hypothetical protein O6H91_16G023600 [Diphasiastrum complanatum]|uniref:Uncharacterized protein n=1 Tax=Diphasiastrum complanatum TaxID=34168 RepID=A0ACC2BAL3_DIPCM|nr:hypothetical protein O6H91_16G023600 [Diphasiastrum complanatum]